MFFYLKNPTVPLLQKLVSTSPFHPDFGLIIVISIQIPKRAIELNLITSLGKILRVLKRKKRKLISQFALL
ncbi:hypothetical protein THOG11_100047 [Vibrio harveyi]|nr:hypothetical protein VHARVF571_120159 [Vibrio harveyi]CAH1550465.1 hypothetical protein THOG11_100047 [Vibrio harveyi]CAH1582721.1 hypothetical protein THOD03_80046 [Vibrio harveyi]